MSGGSGTNIFMSLITTRGPVIGEALKEGMQTAIEVEKFSWSFKVKEVNKDGGKFSLPSKASMLMMAGIGSSSQAEMGTISLEKKFDLASPMLHAAVDNRWKIITGTITVLHIKPGDRPIHQPGFILNFGGGEIKKADVKMSGSGSSADLTETLTFNPSWISITYLRSVGKDNVPTNPFIFGTKPTT